MPSLIRAIFDPAWLFLLSGLAILAACVLVPAQDRFEEARWQRDRAQTMLAHAQLTLDRYEMVNAALGRGDESLIRTLVASQLNLVPIRHSALGIGHSGNGDRGSLILTTPLPLLPIVECRVPSADPLPIVLASSRPSADILASVEPDIPSLPMRRVRDTRLRRLVMDEGIRLLLLIGGCGCVAIGLFRTGTGNRQ